MSSPFAFHSLLFFVYYLSANFQSIWWYSHQNQLEPVSQSRLMPSVNLFLNSSCILLIRIHFFLDIPYSFYLLLTIKKKVTNLSGRIYSSHSSLLFLSIADDLIELKIVTDFSHLIPTPLFQGRKSAVFFFLLNSFIDKVKDFSFLLQIHCENRRQFSQMEICHIIMEMSDFHPGHIDKKP